MKIQTVKTVFNRGQFSSNIISRCLEFLNKFVFLILAFLKILATISILYMICIYVEKILMIQRYMI